MASEYDFHGGEVGKYARRFAEGHAAVVVGRPGAVNSAATLAIARLQRRVDKLEREVRQLRRGDRASAAAGRGRRKVS